ncbi:MAG: ABC transporter substrate-binding protein [Candidatus Shapirobacteria bacterium]
MFTKIRFKLELYSFYFKKNFLYIFLGLVLGIAGVNYQKEIIIFYKKVSTPVTKIGIEGLYTTTNLPLSISQKISFGLTQISENGKPTLSPFVKEMIINQEKNIFTFKIDTSKTWHNGKKLVSSDIKYVIPGVTFSSPANDTLIVTTDKLFSPLESILSKPLYIKGLVGLGEYSINKINYQDGYISFISLISPKKQKIIYRFYQNQSDLLSAFKIGEVDQIEVNSDPSELESGWNINITKNITTNTKYSAIFLNTQILNNKQLRQALAYATPKSTDKNDRCLSPISSTSWAYNPTVKEYSFNPTRARELFEKNKIESINLSVGDRSLLTTAENIKKNWEDILKIKVNLTVGQIDPNNFDAIISYGSIPTDPDQYVFWHSTQIKSNITKLNNPKIDKLLEDGRSTFDFIERKRLYQEFQKSLLEESPTIFLTYPTVYTITRTKQ